MSDLSDLSDLSDPSDLSDLSDPSDLSGRSGRSDTSDSCLDSEMLKFEVFVSFMTEFLENIWKKGNENLNLQNVNTCAHFLTNG